jgi:hypothetical protein
MTRYLISFPSAAMDVPEEDGPDVARDAHAVIQAYLGCAECWWADLGYVPLTNVDDPFA